MRESLRGIRVAAVVASLCLLAAAAGAHDTWLAPDRYHVTSAGRVTMSLTSGMDFPKLDHPIKADRVAVARARHAGGAEAPLAARTSAEGNALLAVDVRSPVTTVWVELHPRPSELKADQVREYIDHLNIADPEAVFAAWQRKGLSTARYRYVKYAKTFVGGALRGKDDRGWSRPAGMRLEFVPQNDPTRIRPGQRLSLLLVENGKALGRYPISVLTGGGWKVIRTDDQGIVSVDIASAGPGLVRAATLVPSAEAGFEWDVHFTTLTFAARHRNQPAPARRR